MAMTIGETLIEMRKKLRIPQGEMAKMLSVSQSYLSRVERGLMVPSIDNVLRMAESMGVSVAMLLGEKEVELSSATEKSTQRVLEECIKRQPRIMPLLKAIGEHADEVDEDSWEFGAKSLVLALEMVHRSLPEKEKEEGDA